MSDENVENNVPETKTETKTYTEQEVQQMIAQMKTQHEKDTEGLKSNRDKVLAEKKDLQGKYEQTLQDTNQNKKLEEYYEKLKHEALSEQKKFKEMQESFDKEKILNQLSKDIKIDPVNKNYFLSMIESIDGQYVFKNGNDVISHDANGFVEFCKQNPELANYVKNHSPSGAGVTNGKKFEDQSMNHKKLNLSKQTDRQQFYKNLSKKHSKR